MSSGALIKAFTGIYASIPIVSARPNVVSSQITVSIGVLMVVASYNPCIPGSCCTQTTSV